MAVLECEGLRRSFGSLVAVDGVGFEIARGETFGLLGPNGAGKTTTISMCVGLLTPDDGSVVVAGEPMRPEAVAAKRHVGLVPQQLAIYPDLTGRENLRFFARLYDIPDQRARVGAVLEAVGLTERAGDLASTYSGGMQRRLNIAIGLLHEPQLLVLDEPTVGVDPQSRDAILGSIERLAGEGIAVLYTTHYMEEAERLCDRVGIMDEGRIVAEGTRRELVDLIGEDDQVVITPHGDPAAAADALREVPAVRNADVAGDGVLVTLPDAAGHLVQLLHGLEEAGVEVAGLEVLEPDLEAVFLHLTGRALRD